MRKGAAGSGLVNLSSANGIASTFADVAYSKASNSLGAFFFVFVVDNLPQSFPQCKSILENIREYYPQTTICSIRGSRFRLPLCFT